MIDIQELLTKYRLELAEAGLKECLTLQPEQKGNMVDFYDGSIIAFQRIKELTLEQIENALDQARQEDHRLYNLGSSLNDEQLAAYWKQRGLTTQLDFVHGRLRVMEVLLTLREATAPPEEPPMTRHDKLVEEIRLLWCEECAEGRLSWEYGYDETDEPCTSGAEDPCRERARKIIARVVEGPLPGEVGRAGVMSDIEEWADRMATDGAMDFIALRPTGTSEFPHFEPDEPSFIAEIH